VSSAEILLAASAGIGGTDVSVPATAKFEGGGFSFYCASFWQDLCTRRLQAALSVLIRLLPFIAPFNIMKRPSALACCNAFLVVSSCVILLIDCVSDGSSTFGDGIVACVASGV